MTTRILISILNWNASDKTLECVHSLLPQLQSASYQADIRVIDNGSKAQQLARLQAGLPATVELHCNPVNTGFTGGQNANIRHALAHDYDLVWLLNNDTLVYPDTIAELVRVMAEDPGCGAASPVILRLGQPSVVDFCGAIHEWQGIDTLRPDSLQEANDFLDQHQDRVWAVGTALMLRCATLRQIGPLAEEYFAYYEDDDIGARLIAHGWRTRIVLSSRLEHACFDGDMYQRQPYFFYLMARNAIFFSLRHVPRPYRRLLRLRQLDRSIVMANKLRHQGQPEKADACLLGVADGLLGRGGPPRLNRRVPLWIRALVPLGRYWNRKA